MVTFFNTLLLLIIMIAMRPQVAQASLWTTLVNWVSGYQPITLIPENQDLAWSIEAFKAYRMAEDANTPLRRTFLPPSEGISGETKIRDLIFSSKYWWFSANVYNNMVLEVDRKFFTDKWEMLNQSVPTGKLAEDLRAWESDEAILAEFSEKEALIAREVGFEVKYEKFTPEQIATLQVLLKKADCSGSFDNDDKPEITSTVLRENLSAHQ